MNYSGNDRKLLIFGLTMIFIFLITPACAAAIFYKNGTDISPDTLSKSTSTNHTIVSNSEFPIEFFYSSHCGSCKDVQEFLQSFDRKNPGIIVHYHNLVSPGEIHQLFTEYKKLFNKNEIHYPVIFFGDIGITGSSDIIHHLKSIISSYYVIS